MRFTTLMMRAIFSLSLILLAGALLAAQDSSQSGETFTSNSELVLVPVQVTDAYGRPVHGLKQSDFTIESDHKPQRVGLFEELLTPQTAPPRPPLLLAATPEAAPDTAPVKFTNMHASVVPQQLFIVVIDNVNTPALLQTWAREQLVKYLRASPPLQPMEIVAFSRNGLRVVHGFTTDTAAMIDSIRKMKSGLTGNDNQEVLLSRMDRNGNIDSYASLVNQVQERDKLAQARNFNSGLLTLRSFEQLAFAYSGIPGRKTVLWLTCGFPLMPEVPDGPALIGHSANSTGTVPYSRGQHPSGELLPEFQRAFTAMNRANVMVYPVDVNGLPIDNMWDASQPAGLFIHPEIAHMSNIILPDHQSENRDGMREMAHRTGGKSCTAGNNLKVCLEQALTESSDYYLLGFYVPQRERKTGWHKLKVKVTAGHGEVRSRNTYYLRPLGAARESEQEEDLLSAMYAPVDYTGVLFTVEPGTQAATPTAPIPFKVSVPATSILLEPGQNKLSFDVIAIPMSNKGMPVFKESRIVKLDMTEQVTQTALTKGWNLVSNIPGDNSIVAIKLVIRDNGTGRIGSVTFPVKHGG